MMSTSPAGGFAIEGGAGEPALWPNARTKTADDGGSPSARGEASTCPGGRVVARKRRGGSRRTFLSVAAYLVCRQSLTDVAL